MDITAAVTQLMAGEPMTPESIHRLIRTPIEDMSVAADVIGESVDYVVEAMLQRIVDHPEIFPEVHDHVLHYWLEIDAVPGGSCFEIVVRAAECLAAEHVRSGVSMSRLDEMANSVNWRVRLVCAWTIRDMAGPRAAELRARLGQDVFADDNGIFLVREGVGVYA